MIDKISNNQWIAIIIATNLILIGTLTALAYNFGSNKALIVFWTLNTLVLFGNILVWLVVRGFAPKLSREWLKVIIGLAITFWPLSQLLVK